MTKISQLILFVKHALLSRELVFNSMALRPQMIVWKSGENARGHVRLPYCLVVCLKWFIFPMPPLSPRLLNTWFNKRLVANPTQGRSHFPHTFQNSYVYLIITKMDILSCSLHGHIDSPDHVDYGIQNSYQILNTQSNPVSTLVFLLFVLGATLNHTPLKCKFPSKWRDQTRHVNFIKWILNKQIQKKYVREWNPLKRNVPFNLCFCFLDFFFLVQGNFMCHLTVVLFVWNEDPIQMEIVTLTTWMHVYCVDASLRVTEPLDSLYVGGILPYQNITFITKERLGSCGVHVNTSTVDERCSHKSKPHVHLRSRSFELDFFRLSQIHWCHFRSPLA